VCSWRWLSSSSRSSVSRGSRWNIAASLDIHARTALMAFSHRESECFASRLLWDNHITSTPYGIAIEETHLVSDLFHDISRYFGLPGARSKCSGRQPSDPISLTLRKLPTSLVRLSGRWRLACA